MDKKRILIVEDDEDIARGLRVRLRANGYTIVSAADASSAMEMASRERPDLVLLDLGLPDDNGFIIMKRMEETEGLSSIPVIVVTGRPPQVYKEAAFLAGAKKYLQKPVDNDELLSAVREVLAR